jgi:SAM-dependent methyltransferase
MAMDAAAVAPGEAVLDIGCGCGSTTLTLARRVLPGGSATGLDISRPMLELARERAEAEGLTNVTFTEADAQTQPLGREFDVVYSRFGVMFFDDSVRAFTNLLGALKSGGRLAFVCWQPLPLNPWMAVPIMAALKHVTIETPSSPQAPGPFAFADPEYVEGILGKAGFQAISIQGRDVEVDLGGGADLDETAKRIINLGPLARSMVDSAPEVRALVADEVRAAIAGYATADGVRMPGAIWLVTAKG